MYELHAELLNGLSNGKGGGSRVVSIKRPFFPTIRPIFEIFYRKTYPNIGLSLVGIAFPYHTPLPTIAAVLGSMKQSWCFVPSKSRIGILKKS